MPLIFSLSVGPKKVENLDIITREKNKKDKGENPVSNYLTYDVVEMI